MINNIKTCDSCIFWRECSSNHGSAYWGNCHFDTKNENCQIYTQGDQVACENWKSEKEFEFGKPIYKENLPETSLDIGKIYFIPMRLKSKERIYDGGRGSEYYVFEYINKNAISKELRIRDNYMSKEIYQK